MEYKGYKINLEQDIDAASPREWSNLSIISAKHRKYNFEDSNCLVSAKNYNDIEELKKDLEEAGAKHIMPLYCYEHGNIRLELGKRCQFDSGLIGFIYTTKDVMEEMGIKEEDLEDIYKSELEEYNKWINGEVVGYEIFKDGKIVDSYWGYYDDDECIAEAENVVDSLVKEANKKRFSKLKAMIKNKVALEYRTTTAKI